MKLLARAAIIAPSVKRLSASKRTGFLPKIWENDAHDGWKTVDVRRNDVPVLISEFNKS